MPQEISDNRKVLYYVGGGLRIVGLLVFLSTFLMLFSMMKSEPNSMMQSESVNMMGSFMFRAIAGVILIGVGSIINRVGARGLAGSGLVLDPEKAREELEPYSRMAGGMVKDALDEANVKIGGSEAKAQVVMIRCRACGRLNEEDSKFCQECGKEL